MAAQCKTNKERQVLFLVTEAHFNRLFLQVMKTSASVVFSGQVVISHSSAGLGNKKPFWAWSQSQEFPEPFELALHTSAAFSSWDRYRISTQHDSHGSF